jgi:methyltransferase-like protein/trans-aconitate methyltransferase
VTQSTEQSYDRVPYLSNPFPETHPARMEAVGHLFGMRPPPVQTASVLELGCAGGGNLAPMAYALPEARFVGIDLSGRQIEMAREAAAALGVKNTDFRHMSITDVTQAFGRFDYIICHGVFSWVPLEVRRHVLRICQENLNDAGVAFISFNTYPGWHRRRWARDMMIYHAQRYGSEGEQVKQARGLLKLLAESPLPNNPHTVGVLKGEYEQLADKTDDYILHEYLEDTNDPMYFHEFMEMAGEFGLQYLGDARLNGTQVEQSWAPARQLLMEVASDIVREEQYADFLRNRMFRRALLVKSGNGVNRAGIAQRLTEMRITSSLRRDPKGQGNGVTYVSPRGGGFVTQHAPIIAVLDFLWANYPRALRFNEIISQCRIGPEQAQRVAVELAEFWMGGMLEAYVTPPRFALVAGERPLASAVVRYQAPHTDRVTTLRHEILPMDASMRELVQLLDGTRTRADLMKHFSARAADPAKLGAWVDQAVGHLTRAAVMVER